jgi:hypothetical protein
VMTRRLLTDALQQPMISFQTYRDVLTSPNSRPATIQRLSIDTSRLLPELEDTLHRADADGPVWNAISWSLSVMIAKAGKGAVSGLVGYIDSLTRCYCNG